MIKTYKANTNVSINVVLQKSKKNLHISFSPLSNGNSTFTTDNEEIIKAIESHYNYGKLFRLHETLKTAEMKISKGAADDNRTAPERTASKTVTVPDIASAKDYLADVCGISRTVLRTERSIMEQAEANGIRFNITDRKE